MQTTISRTLDKLRAAGCVFAEAEAKLLIAEARTPLGLDEMVGRRIAGEPLEYILGWAEFCHLRIAVGPGAFVPRRRTEFLARKALALIQPNSVVVDLGCGAGALATVVASNQNEVELYATDIDPAQLKWARRNLAGTDAQIFEGNLFEPLPASLHGRINILMANMPYVPTRAIGLLPSEARIYESQIALDGGADGLDLHRQVASAAPKWLAKGGHLLIETSSDQAPEAKAIFSRSGLQARVLTSKKYDATIIIGTRPVL